MLEQEQIEWICDFLSGSGRMGAFLLRHIDGFSFSMARTYPKGAIRRDFRWGLSGEMADMHGALSHFAHDVKFRLRYRNAICLFRECDFGRNDPCMKHETCSMVYAGNEVMYFLDGTANEDEIFKTIWNANKFMLMCEFNGRNLMLNPGTNIEDGFLEEKVGELVAVAVGICDDTGLCYVPFSLTYAGRM